LIRRERRASANGYINILRSSKRQDERKEEFAEDVRHSFVVTSVKYAQIQIILFEGAFRDIAQYFMEQFFCSEANWIAENYMSS